MKQKRTFRKAEPAARWWSGSEQPTDWLIEHKGDWWVVPGSEFAERKVSKPRKGKTVSYKSDDKVNWVIIGLSSALGVSFALNIVYFIFN
mgnify:CR=1 FL=1|jgi:hypothetical protein